MSIIRIESLDDPRVAVYRNLKDRELASRHGRFIAEGELVVRRLLASRFRAESILTADRCLPDIAPIAGETPIFAAPQQIVNQIVGYRFHTGVLACGLRVPPLRFEQVVADRGDVLLVVCPDLNNNENLGSMIRLAAGFGATALVLGERSCDPFFRQSVRVSMGAVFTLPIVVCENLNDDLDRMRAMDIERVATVLDPSARPLHTLTTRRRRVAILFGSEAQGLSPEHLARCDTRVTIPMQLGTDSLNVAVSAGIILHHYVYVATVE